MKMNIKLEQRSKLTVRYNSPCNYYTLLRFASALRFGSYYRNLIGMIPPFEVRGRAVKMMGYELGDLG